ncbi:acetylxylan esterase [Allofournierella sp. CML151]|uniref:acetylxylan esterase n=1 Tax=Allofournierella sp. CML151 TaxID=2998082 RepID=UPI0022EA7C6A|nr:alpha/beta fold hydrolase [Fournierella sp. CML151]
MKWQPSDRAFLEYYRGTTPCPEDFAAFWAERMAQAERAPLEWELTDGPFPARGSVRYQELHFRAPDGSRLYAKYIRPASDQPVPLLLHFHGYPGATRSWLELTSYTASMGVAMLAMDCRGQGGSSLDAAAYQSTRASGNMILGLDGPPEQLYYVKVHQDIALMIRIARQLPGLDLDRVYVNGGSQGGALALATAALHPDLIKKAGIQYPFLSDFQKVWEMDADLIAYEGLRYYMRWFDPQGLRTGEIFRKLGYVDSINFAPLIRCPVLFATGFQDDICPPVTQYAVYNRIAAPKRHLLYPDFAHEEIQAFDDRLIRFFCCPGSHLWEEEEHL